MELRILWTVDVLVESIESLAELCIALFEFVCKYI